jgi:hypothetical protein
MNLNLIFEILEIALSVVKSLMAGNVQEGTTAADSLLQIIQKAMDAYQQHTGTALTVS